MSRVGAQHLARLALLTLVTILVTSQQPAANASEFPERECCDPIYPIPEPTSRAPSAATPTGRSGSNIKTPVAILNCLYARQLCFEDASCSAILQIIPRVCGPELVACSTVTVTKCQAALHTLQAFPFFRPTCLCKEPHVDPECNSFQNFLFDHPCVYVLKKDKDPYPIDDLLTCNHALSVCQRDKPCFKLFEDFKTSCRVRDGRCRMESRSNCSGDHNWSPIPSYNIQEEASIGTRSQCFLKESHSKASIVSPESIGRVVTYQHSNSGLWNRHAPTNQWIQQSSLSLYLPVA